MRHLMILVAGVLLASVMFCSAATAQSNPDKLTIGTITLSLNNLPIYVAQDKGFFAKENIFVEAVVLNASTRAIPALIGGSTQLSASSAMTTIRPSRKAPRSKSSAA
jgi:NitT/TauT family transport system substrate-binding protein